VEKEAHEQEVWAEQELTHCQPQEDRRCSAVAVGEGQGCPEEVSIRDGWFWNGKVRINKATRRLRDRQPVHRLRTSAARLDRVSVRGLPDGSVRITRIGEWSSMVSQAPLRARWSFSDLSISAAAKSPTDSRPLVLHASRFLCRKRFSAAAGIRSTR
jgi:hypothetical protein